MLVRADPRRALPQVGIRKIASIPEKLRRRTRRHRQNRRQEYGKILEPDDAIAAYPLQLIPLRGILGELPRLLLVEVAVDLVGEVHDPPDRATVLAIVDRGADLRRSIFGKRP